MTDRIHPSSKPKPTTKTSLAATATATATATTSNRRLPTPPNKSQFPTRHPYRPTPTPNHHHSHRHRSRRGCFCICCFWSILIIILLLLISAIAGCIFYLLYHPRRPTFSIAAIKISELNLTTTADDTTRLTSKLNLTISTRNPNKKIAFHYDSFAITCSSHETIIAKGSVPNSFISKPNNIIIIHSSLYGSSMILEPETVNKMRSDLKKKSGLPLKVVVDTEARVKIESLRSKKVGIRIECEGIHSLIPKSRGGGGGRNSSATAAVVAVAASVAEAKCKIDLRIKIWKWSL